MTPLLVLSAILSSSGINEASGLELRLGHELDLEKAVNLYLSTANATGFYWNLYAAVSLALVGWVLTRENPLGMRTRLLFIVVFLLFTTSNLGALINKHSLHELVAEEVIAIARPLEKQMTPRLWAKLTTDCRGYGRFLPFRCLHATGGSAAIAFHLPLDLAVIGVLWWGNRLGKPKRRITPASTGRPGFAVRAMKRQVVRRAVSRWLIRRPKRHAP
jgi:hypothetical protein